MSIALPNVLDFEDYRAFLLAHYEARKAARKQFSYRFMATRLDVDPGQLVWILKGKLHLSPAAVTAAIRLCHLEGRDAAYFEELVRLGRARSAGEKARSRERLAALRGVDSRPLGEGQEGYYASFHHSVLRALAPLARHATPAQLGAMCIPPLPPETSEESLRLLQTLGLLQGGRSGWHLADAHITAGGTVSPSLLRDFHAQAIGQAMEALQTLQPGVRDISSLTVALPAKEFETVRGWLADLRRKLQKLAEDTPAPDRVLQFNAQLFPVGRRPLVGARP